MQFSGFGGGIMLAIAAALWLVYLVPNWSKRREYLATEMNAVRLQQTIRVLAQTAEAPRVAPSGPVAVGRPVTLPHGEVSRPIAGRRLRRTRAFTSLLLLAALIAAGVQISFMVSSGAAVSSWLVLAGTTIVAWSSLAMLASIARVARSRRSAVARPARRTSLAADHELIEEQLTGWTPVPLPKPLYLGRPTTQSFSSRDAAFEMELAAASAERALRAIEQPPSIAPTIRPAASRFANMGFVDAPAAAVPDLDAVLARRRAAG
jgi:hypothetical protein